MTRILITVFLFLFLFSGSSLAQDTLPKFTVTTRGTNKIFISWTNTFEAISQISIQRSLDSTKNFKTILTVPDPRVRQNGFVDSKSQTPFMFYRLFIVLEGGKYLFSKSSKPFWDTAHMVKAPVAAVNGNGNKRVLFSEAIPANETEKLKLSLRKENSQENNAASKTYILKRGENILGRIAEANFKNFYDSIVYKTKDTIVFKTVDTVLVKAFVPKVVYRPSEYVYTEKDGNITISLADAPKKQYSIKFFEENETELFEIKQVKNALLTLDKSNFLHAGWFWFELYEEGKLKEKHRFYIPKDF
ncbi:MAG: hypothetical protein H7122_12740 [Chitinophagaceae bacterium]|nr:hypothetical protein [Chitinophagaceae bacterium]